MSCRPQPGCEDYASMGLQASFKYVAHTYKLTRAWELPLLMPAYLWKQENGTWTQSSKDTEKISQDNQRTDIPLTPHPPYALITLTPWFHDHYCYQIPVFPCCPKTSQELSSPLQPTLFLSRNHSDWLAWTEPWTHGQRSFWGELSVLQNLHLNLKNK